MEYIIYSKWLAYELRKRGFKILRTGVNPNFPQFDTYIFQDCEEFQKALTDLTSRD